MLSVGWGRAREKENEGEVKARRSTLISPSFSKAHATMVFLLLDILSKRET